MCVPKMEKAALGGCGRMLPPPPRPKWEPTLSKEVRRACRSGEFKLDTYRCESKRACLRIVSRGTKRPSFESMEKDADGWQYWPKLGGFVAFGFASDASILDLVAVGLVHVRTTGQQRGGMVLEDGFMSIRHGVDDIVCKAAAFVDGRWIVRPSAKRPLSSDVANAGDPLDDSVHLFGGAPCGGTTLESAFGDKERIKKLVGVHWNRVMKKWVVEKGHPRIGDFAEWIRRGDSIERGVAPAYPTESRLLDADEEEVMEGDWGGATNAKEILGARADIYSLMKTFVREVADRREAFEGKKRQREEDDKRQAELEDRRRVVAEDGYETMVCTVRRARLDTREQVRYTHELKRIGDFMSDKPLALVEWTPEMFRESERSNVALSVSRDGWVNAIYPDPPSL